MYNAPPVAFPVGRFVWGRLVLVLPLGLSAAGLISWQIQSQVTPLQVTLAWGVWLFCGVAAAFWVPRQGISGGSLFWTGEAWVWQAEHALSGQSQAVHLTVAWDTGSGLLLWVKRVDDQGRVKGPLASAWLQADAMPSKWHGFRCAVYSRPMTNALKNDLGFDRH
jgi:hypothetical protein